MRAYRKTGHELVDLAFDAMFVRGFHDRVITSWNRGAERLYGFSRNEAVGRRAADLLGSQYPIPLEQIEDELRRTGHWEGELRQHRKDGTQIVVAGRWGLQTDAGQPLAILEINSDLTRERTISEELLQSEQRFSLLVSAVVDYAIFMLDPVGTVISWNEGAQRIKGYAADEIIGRHFSKFYPPEDVAKHKPEHALEVARRDGRYEEEGWRVRKDGNRFWASVIITVLRDSSGQLRGYGKVTRDITHRRNEDERIRTHAQLMAELEHTKTQFLDLAAHELRGPLTLIRGYNSMLEDGAIPPERIPQVARLLEGRLAQIDLLVEQMLEMARLEHDRVELHLESFDLRQLTLEEIRKFQPVANGHHLSLTADSVRAMVMADRSRIGTIVGNLIDNAIKYSPGGGEIRCSVGTTNGQAFITVSDPGLGIAPDHMPLLFKRFSRLPTEENKSISGTGLALYLCQEIAHRHGGEIVVASKPSESSEFTLRLPGGEATA